MKSTLKGFISGVLITSIITLSVMSIAAGLVKTIKATFNAVIVKIDGKVVAGDKISYGGNVFVSAKSVAQTLGKDYKIDSKGNVSIVAKAAAKPTPPAAKPLTFAYKDDKIVVEIKRVFATEYFKDNVIAIVVKCTNLTDNPIKQEGNILFKLEETKYEEEFSKGSRYTKYLSSGWLYKNDSREYMFVFINKRNVNVKSVLYQPFNMGKPVVEYKVNNRIETLSALDGEAAIKNYDEYYMKGLPEGSQYIALKNTIAVKYNNNIYIQNERNIPYTDTILRFFTIHKGKDNIPVSVSKDASSTRINVDVSKLDEVIFTKVDVEKYYFNTKLLSTFINTDEL